MATTTAGSEAVRRDDGATAPATPSERLAGPVLVAPGRHLAGGSSSSSRWSSSSSSASGRRTRPATSTLAAPNLDNYAAGDPARSTSRRSRTRCATRRSRRSSRSLIGYPIAYWISRYGGSRKVLLLILVMLPFWTSYLIRTYAWMIILRDNGVLNSLLQAVGIGNSDDPLPSCSTPTSASSSG